MKIAYIATSSIPSSTANSNQVMKVCQALTQIGHETCLFIPGRGEITWDDLKVQYGLTVRFPIERIHSHRLLKRFDFILSALRQAKKFGADVLYTRMLWTAVLAQWMHIPVILELHDLPAGRFGRQLFSRFLASKSIKITAFITQALKKSIEANYDLHIPESESVIAPDGVDLERYQDLPDQTQARQKLGLKETLTAVYTGGFYKGRGLELLLPLAGVFPKVQFLWVGGNPQAVEQWKVTIRDLNLENITLTGFVANELIPLYQAAADILLMPFGRTVTGSSGGDTAQVCSPMKMFEYMAAGRAILTSDLPVLREVLNDQNALFYAPEEFEDLRIKFTKLVDDSKLREQLAKNSKTDAAKYSWQDRMHKILSVFNEGS